MINLSSETLRATTQLVRIRRQIHRYPELGFQEKRTSQLIRQHLRSSGIKFSTLAKTGVLAVIEGCRSPEKAILFRADMDALPLQELNRISYASKLNGLMHA